MTQPCRRCGGTGHEPDWHGLGQQLRAARTARGWSLRAAARKAGVSAQYLCDLEMGRRSMQGPKALRVRRILTDSRGVVRRVR